MVRLQTSLDELGELDEMGDLLKIVANITLLPAKHFKNNYNTLERFHLRTVAL